MSGFASEQNLYERLKLAPSKTLGNLKANIISSLNASQIVQMCPPKHGVWGGLGGSQRQRPIYPREEPATKESIPTIKVFRFDELSRAELQ